AQSVSRNGRCGASFGLTCKGSAFGNCCSTYNYCGTGSEYCSRDKCQPGFGDCEG
ncbi:carbohydrate-binding module family 18 protein, partial [Sporormia fimetaria CBS 119925]